MLARTGPVCGSTGYLHAAGRLRVAPALGSLRSGAALRCGGRGTAPDRSGSSLA